MAVGDLQRTVGRNLREYRLAKGLSQEAFADLCGIDHSYMGCVERGESNLALVNIEKIVRALNMPLSEFFKFVDASSDAQN